MSDQIPGRIDLNLLPVFATLMEVRSVTRASTRLGLSQSATSGALSRLRAAFRDPLFVRNGRTFEPTARALEIMQRLAPALAAVESALAPVIPFDPARDERHFCIGCSDEAALTLLPALTVALRQEAPGCTLTVRHADYRTARDLLASGEVSCVVGYLDAGLPANARRRTLLESRFVVLRAANDTAPLDLDLYCSRPHLIVTYRGDLAGVVDERLSRLGRSRRVVLGVPDFALVAEVIAGSDLLATVPETVATRLADRARLRLEPTPFPSPRSSLSLAWRGVTDREAGERWLRERIVALARGLRAGAACALG